MGATKRLPKKLREELSVCCEAPDKVLFLDIETTGLSHYYDEITIVGWSLGGSAQTYIKGEPEDELLNAAACSNAVVTFNGIRFDQRFLKQEFPQIELPQIHIDLMYLCRRVQLTGGQKAIENELGINFRENIAEVDGFAAVLLWHRYLRGDLEALRLLIRYNRADIAAMGAIFDTALKRLEFEAGLFGSRMNFVDWSATSDLHQLPQKISQANPELKRAPSFRELFSGLPAATSKIVGIDLTGSEIRPTGWSLLDGDVAITKTLSSDSDIIEHTFEAKPDLVSIDSPLCLPFGRNTVFDDDPAREEFGIMRQCERELKRRGVNVYPSLLPSMQKLTKRGIELAKVFRDRGLPVIESYPGAAQDIMRIPRKGAGEEWLKSGLVEFGITGEFSESKVTHDELDAITSALVGTFHLASLSEELGTTEEPPLIIPKLEQTKRPLVIGFSGPIAAGKTTLSEVLEQHGFKYTRFSLMIDDILRNRGLELTRENRQALGAEINRTGRQRELAARTIERALPAERVVVDGLRFPEDHAFLKERFGCNFHHIYVEADNNTRQLRFAKRVSEEAPRAEKQFQAAASSEVEKKVSELQQLADDTFFNDIPIYDIESDIMSRLANIEERN